MNKKIIKIAIGIIAMIVIVKAFMDQSGVTDEIVTMQQAKKGKKEKTVWDSKKLGAAELYNEIFDASDVFNNEHDFIGFRTLTNYGRVTSDSTDVYEKISDFEKYRKTYKAFGLGTDYPKGNDEKNKIMCVTIYLPDDCEYVMYGDKKYDIEHASIKTKKNGVVKFNVCCFTAKYGTENKVRLYTKSGDIYKFHYELEEGPSWMKIKKSRR